MQCIYAIHTPFRIRIIKPGKGLGNKFLENAFYITLLHIIEQIIEAMEQDALDSGSNFTPQKTLQVDGGMTANSLLMQMQADILGRTVRKLNHSPAFTMFNVY